MIQEGRKGSELGWIRSFFLPSLVGLKGLSLPDKDSMKTWKSVVVEEARGSVEGLNILEGKLREGGWKLGEKELDGERSILGPNFLKRKK